MRHAGLFDLHCDTLTRDQYPSRGRTPDAGTLTDPCYHLSLDKMPAGTRWVQCFAIFIPDQLRGQDAIDFFDQYTTSFYTQMEENAARILPCRNFPDMERAVGEGKFAALLTVEGGAALAGKLERVQVLRDAGVRMLTLTWEGPNEIGSGHGSPGGLTSFGREVVPELERQRVVIDISHLNDRGVEDLFAVAKRPFAASHSNARSVCGHRRNLPDAFIREMAARRCLIGLNYAQSFLSDDGNGGLDALYRHVCRFLELGAGDCLALGSDYDGTDIHPDLNSVEKSLGIYTYLIEHGIPAETADAILFGNAWRFFKIAGEA